MSSVKYKNLQTHRNMVECYLPGGGSVGKAGKVFIRRYKFLVTWSAISGDPKYNLCGSRCVNWFVKAWHKSYIEQLFLDMGPGLKYSW